MDIKETLDWALEVATCAKEINAKQWQNVMLEGRSGFGKTSITKQWAEEKDILLVEPNLAFDASSIYEEDEYGILRPKKVENPVDLAKEVIFNFLKNYRNKENFILLLDDFHLVTEEKVEAINYTIDTHKIVNPVTNEEIELDNMLFTIAIKTK